MQAYRPLVEFSRVVDAMDGFKRIDCGGMFRVHFYDVGGFDFALAPFIVLPENAVILNEELADRRGHPAVLIAMIVNRTHLTYFPTDRDQLKQRCLVDEVSSVVLAIPEKVRREAVGIGAMTPQEFVNSVDFLKCLGGQFAQFRRQVLNRNGMSFWVGYDHWISPIRRVQFYA